MMMLPLTVSWPVELFQESLSGRCPAHQERHE